MSLVKSILLTVSLLTLHTPAEPRRICSLKGHKLYDLAQSPLCCDMNALEDMPIDDLVQLYDQQMTELLDKHCPL